MNFRIADTFTDSLAKLTSEEQKQVKTTAFDLQLNPANPGMQFHKLDRAKDLNFWLVRVNRDIRLIMHKNQSSPAHTHMYLETTIKFFKPARGFRANQRLIFCTQEMITKNRVRSRKSRLMAKPGYAPHERLE